MFHIIKNVKKRISVLYECPISEVNCSLADKIRLAEITDNGLTIRVRDLTHLREVVYCDIIKHQMTLLLTLSDEIRQKETFKEKSIFFLAFSLSSGLKYIFLPTGC